MTKQFHVLLFCLVALVVGCAQATPTAQPTAVPAAASADAAKLQTLVERYLSPPVFYGSPFEGKTEFLVGELSPHWLAEVPFPPNAALIGTVQRGASNMEALLDSPQPPREVIAFYTSTLKAWSQPRAQTPQGGIVPAAEDVGLAFCKSKQGPAVTVSAFANPNAPTDVRISLRTKLYPGECDPEQAPGGAMENSPLPTLHAPPHARQISGGGGGGTGSADGMLTSYTESILESTLAVKDLSAHFKTQLQEQQWKLVTEGGDGPLEWSRWKLTDKEGHAWDGHFFVLQLSEKPVRYLVHVGLIRESE